MMGIRGENSDDRGVPGRKIGGGKVSKEGDASKMLEAALQQMDGIISGNFFKEYIYSLYNHIK